MKKKLFETKNLLSNCFCCWNFFVIVIIIISMQNLKSVAQKIAVSTKQDTYYIYLFYIYLQVILLSNSLWLSGVDQYARFTGERRIKK